MANGKPAMNPKTVLVAGAGSALGLAIVRELSARGANVIASYRTSGDGVVDGIKAAGGRPVRLDLQNLKDAQAILDETDAAIFTPVLTVSAQAAPLLRSDQPALFFSSNNVAIDPEAEVYAKLLESENRVRASAPQALILRPTMIYGYPGDGNISRLMASMQRWPATPVPDNASSLQQPVFYKDLGGIAAERLFDEACHGATYAVAGPEPVALREVYHKAAAAIGAKPLFLPVPVGLAGKALGLMEKTGLQLSIRSAQLLRASDDKTPVGANILLGRTQLEEGLASLASAMK